VRDGRSLGRLWPHGGADITEHHHDIARRTVGPARRATQRKSAGRRLSTGGASTAPRWCSVVWLH